MSDTRKRVALAERAARAGGAIARDAFRGDLEIETKSDKNDLVTDADRETQRQIVHTVAGEYPEEPFVCEEDPGFGDSDDGSARRKPRQRSGPIVETIPEEGPCWVVDPIDGTANFARGLVVWTASVAALADGETVAAATYLPTVQDVYTAGAERATRNGETLTTSDRDDPETFAVGLVAAWPRERSERLGALTRAVNERFGDSRRFGSLQATLSFVASGELEAAVTTEPTTPWDTLAGVKLIRAAGGTVTDLNGEPWTRDSGGLLASNGVAHDAIVSAVSDVLGTA